ncbi:Thiosulfate sulfurtransferase GlpE [Mycovorax composti]|jgi:phage shock protein E|uniref:Thiosulfate sulfurtransferase GlpE n=1 Tax=Mycovorax composti TaxID=2962693 RepID=A0ABZ2EM62_9BACT|nr:rhodanese-like domain-containing protein [Flavobacteriaceae bacterium]HUI32471.1 rhodanese-like domain-containing protein [Dysgonamonadaceae bacterium]
MLELFQNIIAANQTIQNHVFLVDVRTPDEFAEGSVEGAVNIPLSVLEQEFSQFKNKENIVVFCRSGARSGNAKLILEQNGFERVINGGPWQNVQQALDEILQKK